MAAPDPIFDTRLLRRRLVRAIVRGAADFLLTRTVKDIAERLETVQRRFDRIADAGTPGPQLVEALAARWPHAAVLQVAPTAHRSLMVRSREAASRTRGGPGISPPGALVVRDATFGGPHHEGAEVGAIQPIIGDPEALPLAPTSLDLIVSALALQSANDLPGALVQIRRALKPDGLFLGALLGGRTLHELRSVLTAAESELTGGVSPRVAPFADVRDMGGLLQRAGFALPVADSETLTVRYDDLCALMADLRAMGATNALVARSRRPARRALFLRAAALYQQRFSDADGRIRATFEIVSLSGWAPHESQQKPAPRGSGKVSLAEALHDKSGTR